MLFIFYRSVLVDFCSCLLLNILINPILAKILRLFPFYSCCTMFLAVLHLIALMTVSVDLVRQFGTGNMDGLCSACTAWNFFNCSETVSSPIKILLSEFIQ